MTTTPSQRQPRSPFTDDEFRTLPVAERNWWARVFHLMLQFGISLELARRAVEESDQQEGGA